MRAKAFPLLEQTIEDGVRFYLLNRINKYVTRAAWVKTTDPVGVLDWKDAEIMVREVAEEAADHIMGGICEAFTFTDDEAVVPRIDEDLLKALNVEFEKMHAMHAADADGSLQQAFHSGKMSALLWTMWAAEGGEATGLVEPVVADAGKYECKSEAPCEKASEAAGVDKIIALIEEQRMMSAERKGDAIDEDDWAQVIREEAIYYTLEFLLRRIKAEDFTPLHEDS